MIRSSSPIPYLDRAHGSHRRPLARAVLSALLLPAILAATSCSSPEERETAARLMEIEAKAEAADKRSRKALTMAISNAPSGMSDPDPTAGEGFVEDQDDDQPREGGFEDGVIESGGDEAETPPAPLIPPGSNVPAF